MIFKNKWQSVAREIRLRELMQLIPEEEFVIVFDYTAGANGYQEEDALFNGQVQDWWKEEAAVADALKMRVLGFQARELETVVGPVVMIVVEF